MKHFICTIFLLHFVVSCLQAQENRCAILINQEGYYPFAPKVAIIAGDVEACDSFFVVDIGGKDTVYRAPLGPIRKSAFMRNATRLANFSAITNEGGYHLLIRGQVSIANFSIAGNIHRRLATASLKAFYFIRSNEPLDPAFAGKWSRPAGHPDTIVFIHSSAASPRRPAGSTISSPGGWYDAGDYNKYIVNSGITMGTLLSAYEDFPEYFNAMSTQIPESGNNLPDLIDEVLYNLRWMMSMQDPGDGGVYHKCTNAAFDGMVMPGVTRLPRYVVQKSTAASLDFAAVMAQAARIFRPFGHLLPGLADSCLNAATAAWDWAKIHPAIFYDQNVLNKQFSPAISTGAYGDRILNDEWFWAAAELYATTKSGKFYPEIVAGLKDSLTLASWSNVRMLGYYSLIRVKANTKLSLLKKRVIDFADKLSSRIDLNALGSVMGQSDRDFVWGSNAVAANQSIALINAYFISHNKKYISYALTNLDYLLGRNATGFCFVTGFGSKSTLHPHHRPSVADGIPEPVPGLLAGGPNPGQQDRCSGYPSSLPAESYLDDDCAYASNEIAINWNAPLVYLANAMEALQRVWH